MLIVIIVFISNNILHILIYPFLFYHIRFHMRIINCN